MWCCSAVYDRPALRAGGRWAGGGRRDSGLSLHLTTFSGQEKQFLETATSPLIHIIRLMDLLNHIERLPMTVFECGNSCDYDAELSSATQVTVVSRCSIRPGLTLATGQVAADRGEQGGMDD